MVKAAILLLAVPAGALTLNKDPCYTDSPCDTVPPVTDPCACKSWADVYSLKESTCGDVLEYTPGMLKSPLINKTIAAQYLHAGFCTEFFEQLSDNSCVNVAFDMTPGQWYSGQTWCFTSVGCSLPTAVAVDPIKTHAKVKFCGGDDHKLSSMTVASLVTFTDNLDLDLGITLKFAYPVEHTFSWDSFKNETLLTACAGFKDRARMPLKEKEPRPRNLALEEKLKPFMAKMKDGVQGMVVPGSPSFGVITGTAVYEVTATAASLGDTHPHPSAESAVDLICGVA